MEKVTIGISGMTCGGCVRSVTNVLKGVEGVSKADVSLEQRRAQVEFDPQKVKVEQLKRAIEDAGYEVSA